MMCRAKDGDGVALLACLAVGAGACGGTLAAHLQNTASGRCAAVTCQAGEVCNPQDGLCWCGGVICDPDTICDPTLGQCASRSPCTDVECESGEACDLNSGTCVCGTGAHCTGGKSCVQGSCVDLCFGLHCEGGQSCYAGLCRCGSSVGPICNSNELCQGGTCLSDAMCVGVSCRMNQICNATDGRCHCATWDGPVCLGSSACLVYDSGSGLVWDGGFDGGVLGFCSE